jgi:hypothetical protein
MKSIILDNSNIDKYDTFLLNNEKNLFFYSIPYKNFLEELLNCESEYICSINYSDITGVLPIMYKKGRFGKVLNSLPYYGSNGGIVYKDEESFNFLVNEYNNRVKDLNIASATLISSPFFQEQYLNIKHSLTDSRIGQITPINYQDEVEDSLFKAYHSKTRNMVRKAKKIGLKVEIDNDAISFLEKTHIENMNKIGGLSKDNMFFKLINKHFIKGKDYNIYTAKLDGELTSALLLFYFNKTVEYYMPVIKSDFRTYQPLSLIIFRAMIDSAKNGFKYWNWGGTWKNQEGVYRFKKRWNAKDHEYFYYIQINNEEIFHCSKTDILKEYPGFYVIPFDRLK